MTILYGVSGPNILNDIKQGAKALYKATGKNHQQLIIGKQIYSIILHPNKEEDGYWVEEDEGEALGMIKDTLELVE